MNTKWKFLNIIILCFLILIIIYISFNNKKNLNEASYIYFNVIRSFNNNDIKSTKTYSFELIKNHSNTIYSDMSKLILVKLYTKEKNYRKARIIINSSVNDIFYDIFNIRLIKLLIKEKKYQEALNFMKNFKHNKKYNSIYEDLKGDIYFKMNNIKIARISYVNAIKHSNNRNEKFNIKLKLINIDLIKNDNK